MKDIENNKGCFNLKSRYQLGREAYKKAQVIVEIHEARNFPDGVSRRLPPRTTTFKEYEAFESRASTLNKIMEALRDDDKTKKKMIGVWGMGGVGKTTLVKQVAEQAKQEKLFSTQVYIDVTWTREDAKFEDGISSIQRHIADMLGLELKEATIPAKAGKLMERLKKEKILIVLDDIWKEINLEQVGIPSPSCNKDGDEDDDGEDCKIVLASRDEDLLRKDMGAKELFRIQHLEEEEAWELFQKTAGTDSVEGDELLPTAREVVKECMGLPVAIVTIAKALKGERVAVWKNALDELKSSGGSTNIRGVEKKVYGCLELSYNYLNSEEAKSIFLLCGSLSYGDIMMDQLLKCAMGLDSFDRTESLEKARNKLIALVRILKASSLLLDGDGDREYQREPSYLLFMDGDDDNTSVRMHDVVRDVARSIASKHPHYRFAVLGDVRLEDECWSETVNESKLISLYRNSAVPKLPQRLVCPKLQFFLLQDNSLSLNIIPDTFFEGMKGLKVLDLSQTYVEILPSSLQSLANLRSLCLDRCYKLRDLAVVGELKKLQILTMVGSNIQQLPQKMAQLTNLRMLDLNHCWKLKAIPPNILSSLSRLECLLSTLYGKSNNTYYLLELNHLHCLRVIQVQIPEVKFVPTEDKFFENLTGFAIFIGNFNSTEDEYKKSKTLKLKSVDGSLLLRSGMGKLLKKTEELELAKLEKGFCGPISATCVDNLKTLVLKECHELKSLFLLSTARALPQLEELKIEDCRKMQQIIEYKRVEDEEDGQVGINFTSELETTVLEGNLHRDMPFNQVPFSNMKKFELIGLPKLKEIWHHQLPLDSFSNLGVLRVENCGSLLNLIPCHLIGSFKNLKEILVDKCKVLEHVFDLQSHDDTKFEILPKLETLDLHYLLGLKGIVLCNNKNDNTKGCWNFHNLKYLSIRYCGTEDKNQETVDTSIQDRVLFDEKVSFSNMKKLDLFSIPKLKEIWHHQLPLDSFSNLGVLRVDNCGSLLNLIPCHLIESFKNLKVIVVNNCKVLEHVFHLRSHDDTKFEILPKLETLELENLVGLKGIILRNNEKNDNSKGYFSPFIPVSFHNLKRLIIRNCGTKDKDQENSDTSIEDGVLFGEKVSFPNLKELRLYIFFILKMIWHPKHSLVGFSKLRILSVYDCPRLVNLIPSPMIHNLKKDKNDNSHCNLKDFQYLKELRIINCKMFLHEKISFSTNLEVVYLENLSHLKEIGFGTSPKLATLVLKKLPELSTIVCNEDENTGKRGAFSLYTFKNFHNLKKIHIDEVGMEDGNRRYAYTPAHPNKKGPFVDGGISNYETFESRTSSLNQIMNALRDDKMKIIGVCGIGGVGKSTLVKQVAEEAILQQNLFTKKIYIDVSWTQHLALGDECQQILISDIQRKIAAKLGFFSRGWNESTRAAYLKKMLKKKKTLIILDGIWKEIDLEKIGIHTCNCKDDDGVKECKIGDDLFDDDDGGDDDVKEECKVVMISRDREVLISKGMGAHIVIQVETLPAEEAWNLFEKTCTTSSSSSIGDGGDSDGENWNINISEEVRSMAKQVVEECCEGVPLAIVTIAKVALKVKDHDEILIWKNALEHIMMMSSSSSSSTTTTTTKAVGNKVYSFLESIFSMTHFKGIKSLLLLCAFLSTSTSSTGDAISMDRLLQYAVGLDLFHPTDLSLDQATNKLLFLSTCLLEATAPSCQAEIYPTLLSRDVDNKFDRMHNVFYDVAKEISSNDPSAFVVFNQDVGLKEWSETDEAKRCTFLSLLCDGVCELPQELVCPELQLFLLQNNNVSLNMPNTFFQEMKKLQVLDLSHMRFRTLPSSLDSLANLRTLRLDWCPNFRNIALIGKLIKLEVLSLACSWIQKLPIEMSQLTNLRLLNLNNCKQLKVIPRNVLSSLSGLECLFMRYSFTKWGTVQDDQSNACISELNHLPKLERYAILMGGWSGLSGLRTDRTLQLNKVNRNLHIGEGINKLLERSKELEFSELCGNEYVLRPLNTESFLELKHLKVYNSPEIKYIIDLMDQQFLQHCAFPLLKTLVLQNLKNLEQVWHGGLIPLGSFGNLKTLEVSSCPKLRYLLSLGMTRGLPQLESMTIKNCKAMQQIIAYDERGSKDEFGETRTKLEPFPNLRTLKLQQLPELTNFVFELEATSSICWSTNAKPATHKVSFSKLEVLEFHDLPKLKDICYPQCSTESFSNLQILHVCENADRCSYFKTSMNELYESI